MSATPRPGFNYTVKTGDTLTSIAQRAYGDQMQWSKIYAANSLESGNPNLIFPGEVLFIPGQPPEPAQKAAVENRFASRAPNSYAFLLGNREIPVVSLRLKRSFDSMVDSWIAEIAWVPGEDTELDKLTRRGSFTDSKLYLGSTLCGTGRLYNVKPKLTTSGSSKVLECFSLTADLVDSKMPPDLSYEWSGCTLKTVANDLLGRLGYGVTYDASLGKSGTGTAFDWVNIEKIESYGAFLIRLASQRAVLCANDVHGGVVFQRADPTQKPVGTISAKDIQGVLQAASQTGAPASQEWSAQFSGRDLFALYTVIGQGGDASNIISTAKDTTVPKGRTMTWEGEDLDMASVGNTAAWRRSKQLAKAWTIPIPVTSWYNSQGALWAPGQLVTIDNPYLELSKPATFLVRETEHTLTEAGMMCQLTVVPPQTFTGDPLPEAFQ